jgi:hypothetical protein
MTELLVPQPDDDSQPFWDGGLKGELRMQACAKCGHLRFPPRPMCPWCRSLDCDWPVMSGTGEIWSFVVPHPPLLPAYAELAPYNVVVVALDEDPRLRLVGNLVASPDGAINEIDPSAIEIGQRVRAVFQRVSDNIAMLRWIRSD